MDKLLMMLEIFQGSVNLHYRTDSRHEPLNDNRLPPTWKRFFTQELAVAQFIHETWEPIAEQAQPIIKLLANRVVDIALVTVEEVSAPPKLLYIFGYGDTNNDFYSGWLASPPATSEAIALCEQRLAFSLPASYESFIAVHDGFLVEGSTSYGILPVSKVQLLSEEPALDEWEPLMHGYKRNEVLEFCGDGSGNMQVFKLTEPLNDGDYLTYDWDHESLELSHPVTFWQFCSQFVARVMSQ